MAGVKLVWVSRHELTEKNHEILKKAFGEYEIVQYKNTINNIEELIEFADEHGADAYIAVLPPNLIQELLVKDKRPIYRFVVERILKENGEAEFIPVGLEAILKIEIVTERIV